MAWNHVEITSWGARGQHRPPGPVAHACVSDHAASVRCRSHAPPAPFAPPSRPGRPESSQTVAPACRARSRAAGCRRPPPSRTAAPLRRRRAVWRTLALRCLPSAGAVVASHRLLPRGRRRRLGWARRRWRAARARLTRRALPRLPRGRRRRHSRRRRRPRPGAAGRPQLRGASSRPACRPSAASRRPPAHCRRPRQRLRQWLQRAAAARARPRALGRVP
jgi:hypothetical protein